MKKMVMTICTSIVAVVTMTYAAAALSPLLAAPTHAIWVGGDSSAPNDPTVLANWNAPDGSALAELPGSNTMITNNVADEANIVKIENGMSVSWGHPFIGYGAGKSGKVVMTGGTLSIANMYPGWASGTGEFVQSGGTVSVSGQSKVGNTGTGTLTITGGTFNAPKAVFWFGTEANGKGYLNVGGNAAVHLYHTYFPYDQSGDSCTGTLKIYDKGSLTIHGDLHVSSGKNNNQRGTIVQSGGKLTTTGKQYIGENGGGTYTQTGGTNTASGIICIAYGARVNAQYSIKNGELFANNGINLASNANRKNSEGGQLTLNEGAVVTTRCIQRGSAGNGNVAGRVVCNGGKIVATVNHAEWLKNLQFTYTAAGLTIDTKTFNVTATGCTTGSNGSGYSVAAAEGSVVRKIGSGRLSYSALPLVDNIAVDDGTLAITANANVTSRSANCISVASGAAFDLGGFMLAAQSIAGSGVFSNGTMTVAGTLKPDGTLAFGDNTAVTATGGIALDAGETITLGEGSTLDISAATIVLDAAQEIGCWTFATGPANSITGVPAIEGASGYMVKVSQDGSSARISRKAFIIIVR